MDAPQAVLLVAHYVVSLFGMQLGGPVMKSYPYPTMEICEVYKKEMAGDFKLDMEYSLITRTDCVTIAKFNEITAPKKPETTDE
jgi:hypothetical protein